MESLSFFSCKYLSDPDCLLQGWLARGGAGGAGRGEPRAPPRAPSRRPQPAPRPGRFTGATGVSSRRGLVRSPRGGGLSNRLLHFTLSSFKPSCFLGAAWRPKRDRIFVLALAGRDGVLGQLKCLVYKNYKSIARHPMWVKINPKQKTCLPRGPGGLRLAGGCSQRTPRPALGERGGATLDPMGGVALPSVRH